MHSNINIQTYTHIVGYVHTEWDRCRATLSFWKAELWELMVLGYSALRLVEVTELEETVLSACSLVEELLDLEVNGHSALSLVKLTDLEVAEPADSLVEETDLEMTERSALRLVVLTELEVAGWSADSLAEETGLGVTGFLEVRLVEL
uniref:Uncharacterized protein n=1 Tax=Octopus bimaculoides TaxID=37653 RepID=A0A0L8G7J9_OCTBM